MKSSFISRLFIVLWASMIISFNGVVRAATADGNLRVEVITAYNLIVDSNAGTPSSYAPRSAYVGATFHNEGTTAITDLIANIGDSAAGTPGIYPARAHDGLTGPLPGGKFAFRHEGGSAGLADATRYIAEIPAGGSVTIYWLIGYDQLDENGTPLYGKSIKPFDDLWLEYDIWATADEGGDQRNVDITRTFTFRNEISASANKIYPNGANKVPDYFKELFNQYVPEWVNVNSDGSVGTSVSTKGVWYDFGVVGAGFDNNGDLVPDKNAWMQPVGNPAIFDSGAFRLISTYAYVIVRLKNGSVKVLEGKDQLYFENIPDNMGAVGFVQYNFMPLLPNARSVTSPYQEVASGYDNEKFNADYGVVLGDDFVSGEALVLIDKTASVSAVLPGNSVSYSVSYTNSSSTFSAGNRNAGVPLVVQDSIPAGTEYTAGSATSGNTLPAGVSAYRIVYSADNGLTWSTSEPEASTVTDIQWWLDGDLAPEAAGAIAFSVTVDSAFNEPAAVIVNEAGISFGSTEPFATDTTITIVLGNNSLGNTVFEDSGAGSGYMGNTIQDGSEPGISNITVQLYFDSNNNGTVDTGECLIATDVTDSNGEYLFENLPDGNYIAMVDTHDSDLPAGCTITTAREFPADLDSAGSYDSPVDYLDADFGFAPALELTKTRNFSGTVYEGQEISYTLSVINSLPGDGSGTDSPAVYRTWASSGTTGKNQKSWDNVANAWNPDEPDGVYATAPCEAAAEWIDLTSITLGQQPGDVASVKIILPVRVTQPFDSSDDMIVSVYDNGTEIAGSRFDTNLNLLAEGVYELSFNVTAARAWQWSDFAAGNTLSIHLITDGKPKALGVVEVDAAGFEITSTAGSGASSGATTLDPVPLNDFFDSSRLQFVSSSPSVDSVTTNSGVCTLHWNNLGPVYPGAHKDAVVTFTVLEPAGNVAAEFTNTASVTEAHFLNGLPANEAEDEVVDVSEPAGTIGDYIWRDFNADGIQDDGESGIYGVTVNLYTNSTVLIASTVTDINGRYVFEGLTADTTYTVTVDTTTLPGGSGTCTKDRDSLPGDSTTSFQLHPAATDGSDRILDADFGYSLVSVIRGTVWHDVDHGVESYPEPGEHLFNGVTVRLYEADGVSLLAETATDSDGGFEFTGSFVTNGTYIVKVDDATLGAGTWFKSWDTDNIGTPDQVTVEILSNGGRALADFSYYQSGSIAVGDLLFYDWNGNGVQDPETDGGISGVTMLLYQDNNADGVVDEGIDALAGTTVTSNGWYLFDGLPAGSYNVVVDRTSAGFPARYIRTADPDGGDDDMSAVTLVSTNLLQDFGYQPYGFNSIGDAVWYDANGDGVQAGPLENGITGVTVRLYIDADNSGVWFPVTNTVTDANGSYLFDNLPDASYRVVVESTGSGIPDDALGNDYSPTTATSFNVNLAGSQSYLDADFGFAPLGAIGDTIYWDSNYNASQDWTEPGIPGVTVDLYYDNDGDRLYSAGDIFIGSTNTDSLGQYLFTGLVASNYVVVVDESSTPLDGAILSSDPESDGELCPYPRLDDPACDAQTGVKIIPGTFFMGADFGYRPTGVIGDRVWIDLNRNGVFDSGERGIPYIPVEVYSGSTLVATNVTDGDGFYTFQNLDDGTYTVKVLTTVPEFPAELVAVYDPDGTPDGIADGIVISEGYITSMGGSTVTNADLDVDFGFSYPGSNEVSGTIGMDVSIYDGLMNGTIPSGPGAGEYAFSGVSVHLLLWNDDGNSIVESNEYVMIGSTTTDALGNYSFANLPDGDGDDSYIVSMSAPSSELKLTTSTGDTAASLVVNNTDASGNTISAYQVMAIIPSRENIDFAFEPDTSVLKDFGDLPVSYSTTLVDQPVGPSHVITAGLYLGSAVTADANGQPTSDATGDSGDDGVSASGIWHDGPGGGSVQVSVGAGDGWLSAWVDFNQDGAFTGSGEMIINQAVSSTVNGGVYDFSFDIPTGTLSTVYATLLNARFRLYAEEPVAPTFFGPADGGEVEDYQFVRGLVGNYVWEDLNGDGLQNAGEPGVAGVTVNLYSSDGNTLIESSATASDGSYFFNGLPLDNYVVKVLLPDGSVFTEQGQGSDQELDSDVDATGNAGTVALTAADPARNDIDAGVYVPARIYGYLFDDVDSDKIFNSGDTAFAETEVQLIVDGSIVDTTLTGSDGYYEFTGVPAGVVVVQVVLADADITGVPDSDDPMRNRAVQSAIDTAIIEYSVVSGSGVLAALPGETLNFGYDDNPLSTRIDLKIYDAGGGTVNIEVYTVNENGNNDIEIYAMLGGEWVMVAMVPSEEIRGDGSNVYTVEALGLTPGESYSFKIVDESGHTYETPKPITVALYQLRATQTSLSPDYFTMTFNTEPYEIYALRMSTSLGADVQWISEYVQVVHPALPGGVSGFMQEFQGAPEGTTTVRVPCNRGKAFFKLIKVVQSDDIP